MFHIFLPVDNSLIDIFISQSEEFRNRNDQFLHDAPYPFCNGQFQRALGCVLKKFTHGFVCSKPLHQGKNVVLQSHQGYRRDLRGEVAGLAFAQPQQPLRLLEHDLPRPPLGINPVRFKELKPYIRGHQVVPCTPLASPDKVQVHLGVRKGHVRHNVMATQSPAVLPLALPVKVLDQGRRSIGLPVQTVFCHTVFSHLDHAQVIALDARGADEPDDILTREPAVCQHIPEPAPLRMARLIMAIIRSIFFVVYSSIRP